LWLGDLTRARDELRAAVGSAVRNDNRLAHVYAAGCLALAAIESGDLVGAQTVLHDTDTRAVDAHFVAMFPALARARLAASQGDWVEARTNAVIAVDRARRGAGQVEVAAALVTSALAERCSGEVEGAGRLLGEVRSALRECPDPGPVLTAWIATEKRAWQVLDRASGIGKLTDRERAILALLPSSRSQREIAGALFVTPNTLKTHLRAIYRKLGVASRTEAVTRARAIGLL